jgi:hypothetical protein
MAGIIDSFFVQVGLDASQFTIGQREADKAWTKTKDQTVAAAKQIEENTGKLAKSFDLLKRQAIEFFAAIMGADAVVRFVANVTEANTQLAVLSSNLQTAPQIISEWGLAIERAGGNAGSAMSSFQAISTNVFRLWQQGKQLPMEFMQLQAQASRLPGMENARLDPSNAEAFAESLAKAAAALAAAGRRGDAFQFLTQGGINPDMANVMINQGAHIKEFLATFHDLAPTDEQLKNSQELTKSWAALQQQAIALGRDVENSLNTPLEKFFGLVEDAIKATDDLVKKWDKGIVPGSPQEKLKQTLDSDKLAPAVGNWFESSVEKWLREHFQVRTNENWRGELSTGASRIGDWLEKGISPAVKWFGDNWGIKPASAGELTPQQEFQGGAFGKMPTMSDFEQGRLDVDGRPVSRGNPMPVSISNWAEGMANSFLGGPIGSGTRDTSPGGQGGGAAARGGHSWPGSERGGRPGGSNVGMDERAMTLMDRLIKVHGWTPEAAAIAAGNAQQESGVFSNGPAGDGGISHGMMQWNHERFAALQAFATQQGKDWHDQTLQTDFLNKEAREKVPMWPSQQSLAMAGKISHLYEGFGDKTGKDEATRVANTARFYKMYQEHLKQAATTSRVGPPAHPHTPTPGVAPAHTKAPAGHFHINDPTGIHTYPSPNEQSRLWNGTGGGGHQHLANLSSVAANNHVMNNSSSNAFHVGDVHVNAPHAKDSKAIADSIADALQLSLHASLADYGQA